MLRNILHLHVFVCLVVVLFGFVFVFWLVGCFVCLFVFVLFSFVFYPDALLCVLLKGIF